MYTLLYLTSMIGACGGVAYRAAVGPIRRNGSHGCL
jgi:hypothetical protein